MNRRIIDTAASGQDYPALIICSALFICGAIAGTGAASAVSSGLEGYFARFLARIQGQDLPVSLLPVLFDNLKYHLAAVFFGFSVLGVICLPILSAVRGFFLCFAVSALVRRFGSDGIFLALSMLGINALFTIPCFFILTMQSFSSSVNLLKSAGSGGMRPAPLFGLRFFRRTAVCFAIVVCISFFDVFLVSKLSAFFAAKIG